MSDLDFIPNLTTTVPVLRTIQQIHALVERFGADEWTILYRDRVAVGVRFAVTDPNIAHVTPLAVELQAPTDRLVAMLRKKKMARASWRGLTKAQEEIIREQAERVAWRQLHDFVRASLIAVASGIMSLGEAFLANVLLTDKQGRTLRAVDLMHQQALLVPSTVRSLPAGGAS